MVEGLGGWVEVDVERGAAVVLEMGDESAAEGCLEARSEGITMWLLHEKAYLSCTRRSHNKNTKLRHLDWYMNEMLCLAQTLWYTWGTSYPGPRQNSFSASPARLMNKRAVGAKGVPFVCSLRGSEDK